MTSFIYVPVKKGYDVDLVKPLNKLIATYYSSSDNQVDVSQSIEELNRLRASCISKTIDYKHESALELYQKYDYYYYYYFKTLKLLSSRFNLFFVFANTDIMTVFHTWSLSIHQAKFRFRSSGRMHLKKVARSSAFLELHQYQSCNLKRSLYFSTLVPLLHRLQQVKAAKIYRMIMP